MNMKKIFTLVSAISIASISFAQTNYYVNDAATVGDVFCTAIGDASNNGLTAGTPQLTVQAVFDGNDLGPNDTVFVDNGMYATGTTIADVTDAGAGTGHVNIVGAGMGNTVISLSTTAAAIEINRVPYISISNMTLESAGTGVRIINADFTTVMTSAISGGSLAGDACISIDNSDNTTISRNSLGGAENGIYVAAQSNDIAAVVENNFIWNVNRGIYVEEASMPLIGNQTSGVNDWSVRHNSFYTTGSCMYILSGFNQSGNAGGMWDVVNNIFYTEADAAGDHLLHYTSDQMFGSPFSSAGIDYNIYYYPNNARLAYFKQANATYTTFADWQAVDHEMFITGTNPPNGDENSLGGATAVSDPEYIDKANGNLRLSGTGQVGENIIAMIPLDIDGNSRTIPTIGAWEIGSPLSIEANVLGSSVAIYPNPTTGDAITTLTVSEQSTLHLFVLNTLGQVVSDKTVQLTAGENSITLATDKLSEGVYVVEYVIDGVLVNSEKLVKQ